MISFIQIFAKLLKLSSEPIIAIPSIPLTTTVQDSLLLSNISYQATEALLKLYDQSKSLNKQVFLSFDKAISYYPEANHLLSENTVLRLSSNGNELYGISWNKGKNSDEV